MSRVFILEDDPIRQNYLIQILKGHEFDLIASCKGIDLFTPPYDLLLLDHDLGGSQMGWKHGLPLSIAEAEDCGLTFVKLIKEKINHPCTVVFHSYNPVGAQNMLQELGFGIIAPFRGATFDAILRAFRPPPIAEGFPDPTTPRGLDTPGESVIRSGLPTENPTPFKEE